jgi:hypothetical protein
LEEVSDVSGSTEKRSPLRNSPFRVLCCFRFEEYGIVPTEVSAVPGSEKYGIVPIEASAVLWHVQRVMKRL